MTNINNITILHPTTEQPNSESGCHMHEGEYTNPYPGNHWCVLGYFPTLKMAECAIQTVLVGLIGFGIVPKHNIKFYFCDSQCCYDVMGTYDAKNIVIYALPHPWSYELLLETIAHEVAHYIEGELQKVYPDFLNRWASRVGIKSDNLDEAFAYYFEKNFPLNENFLEWLSREWRQTRGLL